jgi:hypothetical protein
LPPASRISATVSWTSASERAAHTTFAPSRAKSWLMTRPMPLLAPVMIATRSVSISTVNLHCERKGRKDRKEFRSSSFAGFALFAF